MSTTEDKLKHSKRILQKEKSIAKQVKIAKSHTSFPEDSRDIKEPHRLAKRTAMTCGNSNCVMCSNPRKIFGELTIQEKRLYQDEYRRYHGADSIEPDSGIA
jgi:hypothetical protein